MRTRLCGLGLAGLLSAQITLPRYTSSFSVSTATRGFFFQTPVAIVVTGLKVPNEKKHALQNVELYKLAGPPPAYSATAQGGQVFLRVGAPSDTVIPVVPPALYQAGDWVGVLGGCGDASVMHSSYGQGNFQTTVLGQPITLQRLLTQTNLATSGGNQPYSTESGGSIARVEVYVVGQASGIPYGAGAGLGTLPPAQLISTFPPSINRTARLTLDPGTLSNQGGLVLLSLVKLTIPILHGTLLIAPPGLANFLVPGPIPLAGSPVDLPIPNAQAFFGATFYFQGFVISGMDFSFSNGVEWRIGW